MWNLFLFLLFYVNCYFFFFFFFFQAEDGIRDADVTGVQTCALPILGEVGKSTYVYEINNQIFIVDAGILFPDDDLLGIDYVIPDYTYLKENEERIVGLFITHGHEDHIGGIPYLLRQVNIPRIYVSGIAVDLLEYKFREHKGLNVPKIEEYKSYYTYKFNGVEISFIRLNHSIPDMFGIVFRTKYQTYQEWSD